MAYQPIEKPISEKRDCKDFKPSFFNRRYCKLENSCRMHGYHCEGNSGVLSSRPKLCTGITIDKWQKIIS